MAHEAALAELSAGVRTAEARVAQLEAQLAAEAAERDADHVRLRADADAQRERMAELEGALGAFHESAARGKVGRGP